MRSRPRTPSARCSLLRRPRHRGATSSASIADSEAIGLHRRIVEAVSRSIAAVSTAAASAAGLDAMRQLDRRLPREEEGQTAHPVADQGHTELLQAFRRRHRIDDRLGAAAHQQARRARELHQVGAHVQALSRMHAPDAAGRAHGDPGARGGPDRRGHGGRAEAAARARRRKVAPRDLLRPARLGERAELLVGEPDHHLPAEHSDPRGDGVRAADRFRHAVDALDVPRVRQPLADHARLQADDGAPLRERGRAPPSRHGAAPVTPPPPATPRRSPPRSLPPGRRAASASPGSVPRASDASRTPSNASPAPVGSRSSMASGTASYSRPSSDQHGSRRLLA